jgi:DNA-binding NtrC family response regulator
MNFARDASSGVEGFHWLQKIRERDPQAVVVLITAYGDVEMAVRAIKEGATDFVLKPWQNEKLLATYFAALSLRFSRREAEGLRTRQRQLAADLDQPFHEFIGESPAMKAVFDTIRKVAKTDANVLILGENGTGKELAARELHRCSGRAREVFIAVDMGALSDTLFESELFGHVKGAFTDAREERAGRFEIASGGTLFLDEIGNLPLALQAKLLSVLENRKVTRLGSNTARSIDVRLVCASNMPIYEMVEQQRFRRDLLYRINTVVVSLPPLRDRGEDIILLANHFLDLYTRKYKKKTRELIPASVLRLMRYSWPGNVRELMHTVERAVIMSDGPVLRPDDLLLGEQGGGESGKSGEHLSIEENELSLIRKALAAHEGNLSAAARELGLSRPALYRRMEKYGL